MSYTARLTLYYNYPHYPYKNIKTHIVLEQILVYPRLQQIAKQIYNTVALSFQKYITRKRGSLQKKV